MPGNLGLDFFGSLLSGGDIGAGIIDDLGGGDKIFGTKPKVAPYVATDLGAEAQRAAKSNLANAPDTLAYLDKILPGWSAMVEQGSKNTQSLLRGELPKDVQDKISRSSAYKSFAGGYGGSGMAKGLTARDLGLTSLDLTERGSNSAQKWMGMAQGATAPMTITAQQQADQTSRNNLYRQAVEQFKYNVDAAPSPAAAGLFNLDNAIGSQFMSFGMGSAMGAMGGGGGGAGRTNAPSGGYGYSYAYPAPTYAWGQPTSNSSGNAPYGWGG